MCLPQRARTTNSTTFQQVGAELNLALLKLISPGGQMSGGTVVLGRQLSWWDSCPGGTVVREGQMSRGTTVRETNITPHPKVPKSTEK